MCSISNNLELQYGLRAAQRSWVCTPIIKKNHVHTHEKESGPHVRDMLDIA